MDLFEKSCGSCIHRHRDAGGRHNCPLIEFSRRANERQGLHNCTHWKLGDFKPKKKVIYQQREAINERLF